jgi:type VI secretion system Hcp family effector
MEEESIMKALVVTISVMVLCASAAVDRCMAAVYGYFDEVAGVDMDPMHTDWVGIDSLFVPSTTDGTPQGTRVGGPTGFEDISIGIIADKATPKLLEAAVKGKVFKKVEIHGTATYGDAGEQTYLAIMLENVQITSYQLGVLDNNAATDDMSLSLNFEKYKYTYWQFDPMGNEVGRAIMAWDVPGPPTSVEVVGDISAFVFVNRIFVPEPATAGLMVLGALGLVAFGRRHSSAR